MAGNSIFNGRFISCIEFQYMYDNTQIIGDIHVTPNIVRAGSVLFISSLDVICKHIQN